MDMQEDQLPEADSMDRRRSAAISFLSAISTPPDSTTPIRRGLRSPSKTRELTAVSPTPTGRRTIHGLGSLLCAEPDEMDSSTPTPLGTASEGPGDTRQLERGRSVREEVAEHFLLNLQVNHGATGAFEHREISAYGTFPNVPASPLKTDAFSVAERDKSHARLPTTDDAKLPADSPIPPSLVDSQYELGSYYSRPLYLGQDSFVRRKYDPEINPNVASSTSAFPASALPHSSYNHAWRHHSLNFTIIAGAEMHSHMMHTQAVIHTFSTQKIGARPMSCRGSILNNKLNRGDYIKGSPYSIFSLLNVARKPKRRKSNSTINALITHSATAGQSVFHPRKPESFAHFLTPSGTLNIQSSDNYHYNPNYLDDPELKTGKHRTVITLPCFMGSILHPTDPVTLKQELNELFRGSHPMVDPTLTLSQIRRIKRFLMVIAQKCGLELSSVAFAIVFFEKLVLKGMINKENRKVISGACLFLACKVNDPKDTDYKAVLQIISDELSISPKVILDSEFEVFANLEFSLYVPAWELLPHLERIFQWSGVSGVEEYCGSWEEWNWIT